MEFEEILLEEIITIVKEAKDENFMRIDLKNLLTQYLDEYHSIIDGEWADQIEDESYDSGYTDGYNNGYDDACNAVQDKLDDIIFNRRPH